jgi:UDPglucose 6-dehydrogenase
MKIKKLKICVIGTGYVGLVTGTCLAEIGHEVICVDNDKEKIKKLQKGISPIYEPGLEDLIVKNKKQEKLFFVSSIKQGVKNSDIIFIAVNTPTKESGKTDLRYIESVSKEVAKAMDGYKTIVGKSTMPVKTSQKIKEIINKYCKKNTDFDIVSNPEFLREGSAVKDFLHPDRIVIGLENKRAENVMRGIYKPIKAPIIVTDIETAEIIKHACNAFLATKISFINSISNICEKTGSDIKTIAQAMGLDPRIGKSFLQAGIGFGGSCLPKDIDAFIHISDQNGYNFKLLAAVKDVNRIQKENFVKKFKSKFKNLKGKKIGVLGLAFKPDTDDVRNAPSVGIINAILKEGGIVKAYDPAAINKIKEIFKNKIRYCLNPYDIAENSDALLILTEWDEFKKIDLVKIKRIMKTPMIFDGRNIFNNNIMEELGFDYYFIGKK